MIIYRQNVGCLGTRNQADRFPDRNILCFIPQIRPTKIEIKSYQFFHGKLISLAKDRINDIMIILAM